MLKLATTKAARAAAAKVAAMTPPAEDDPVIAALVRQIIERVADQWTMLILEVLEADGVVRFTRLGERVGGISQKMLTQTLRQMECDGLVKRTVHPVIPPKVEYELTPLGRSLGAAFCGVWVWAEEHRAEIERARAAHAERSGAAAKSKHLAANVGERRPAAARLAVREPAGSQRTDRQRGKA